ncbi:MAG TPA: HAD-IA family hydrolase [Candidatus Limnocylindria bacterium]|nr:HAD-IA family hydrolase [Candidatus Limnocylindria bacterium]
MRPICAVLFDWGDTLFSSPDAARVIVEAARDRGVRVSDEEARALWTELWAAGKTPEELAKGRDLSLELHRSAWTSLFERADRVVPGLAPVLYDRVMSQDQWVPYADAEATLRALRARGIRIGVVSNVPRDLAPIFEAKGLRHLIDAFTHSYEVGAEKPDPRIFLAACEKLGVRPDEALMVGDHAVADGGAVGAGLRFLHLAGEVPAGGVRGLQTVLDLVEASAQQD